MRLLALSALALLTPALQGQETAPWLNKLEKAAGRIAEFDSTMTMKSPMVEMTLQTSQAFLDETHSSSTGSGTVKAAGMGGEQGFPMNMKMIADGSHIWIEQEAAAMGSHQVMKLALEHRSKMVELGMGNALVALAGFDPARQAAAMLKDMSEVEITRTDGQVTLRGKLGDIMSKTEQQMAQVGLKLTHGSVTLDEETAYPLAYAYGTADEDFIVERRTNFRFPEKLAAEKFRFEPPASVEVRDLTPAAEQMQSSAPSGQ